MKRLSIYLSDEAFAVYQKWKPHERSKMVSEAIVEKWERDEEGMTLNASQKEWIKKEIELIKNDIRLEQLAKRIEKLESKE